MSKISRRSLARYGAEQLLAGKPASEIASHLAASLAEANMSQQVDFLLGDIAWELERRGELAVGQVVTASQLTSELEAAIKAQIQKATNTKAVLLENSVDKRVLGGMRVETSGKVWDTTISRKLTNLREVF